MHRHSCLTAVGADAGASLVDVVHEGVAGPADLEEARHVASVQRRFENAGAFGETVAVAEGSPRSPHHDSPEEMHAFQRTMRRVVSWLPMLDAHIAGREHQVILVAVEGDDDRGERQGCCRVKFKNPRPSPRGAAVA